MLENLKMLAVKTKIPNYSHILVNIGQSLARFCIKKGFFKVYRNDYAKSNLDSLISEVTLIFDKLPVVDTTIKKIRDFSIAMLVLTWSPVSLGPENYIMKIKWDS